MNGAKPAPNPLRWRTSCPDCGWIDAEWENKAGHHFDCYRCGAHYSAEDFAAEMDAKHQAMHHKHAKADLTQEEI